MKNIVIFCFPLVMYFMSCKDDDGSMANTPAPITDQTTIAEVISVSVSGKEDEYTFSVGIKSPDTGCNQYADWWEVISEDEQLIYRRILAHSHVSEQPFTRSGGPVTIKRSQTIYIRAHMNNSGYGNVVYKGTVESGFNKSTLDKSFASQLETAQPLPNGCAF